MVRAGPDYCQRKPGTVSGANRARYVEVGGRVLRGSSPATGGSGPDKASAALERSPGGVGR